MRSLWKGAVSFGLVHIPCRLYAATEDRDVHFRQLHRACRTPVVYRRTCPHCEVTLEPADIVRGFEVSPGRFVVVEDEELESLGPAAAHVITIMDFVQLADVDPLQFERSYFIGPAEAGGRPYALLRAALAQTGRAAVATLTLRAKERLALIRVVGACLTLETMRYPDEIRDWRQVDALPEEGPLPPREMEVAAALIERLTTAWDPARYTDAHRAAIAAVIASKTPEAVAPVAEGPPERYADLLAALEASVRAAEARRAAGRPDDGAGLH